MSAALLAVLRDAKALVTRESNDFAWSSWVDEADAAKELDEHIARLEKGDASKAEDMRALFLPTGPMQELALNSGWSEEFLALADRFDAAMELAPE
jgi:hypothetical protein